MGGELNSSIQDVIRTKMTTERLLGVQEVNSVQMGLKTSVLREKRQH